MLSMKSVAGPSSYTQGTGITVDFSEFEGLYNAIAVPDQTPEADDTAYDFRVSISGTTVTILVYTIDVTGTSPVSWAELAAATDLSGRTFTVIADGY